MAFGIEPHITGRMSRASAPWAVTFVHGTWGRGVFPRLRPWQPRPRWFEEGSYFRDRLDGALTLNEARARFEAFCWSGANSIVARDRAARRLAEALLAQRRADPSVEQIVVAHSHGGNVALRALAYMPDGLENLRIVTIATPFLELFPPGSRVPDFQRIVAFTALGAAVGWVIALLAPAIGLPVRDELAVIAAVLTFLGGLLFEIRANATGQEPFRSGLADELVRCTSLRGLETKGAKLLVLRGIDDEATLTLAAGAIATRLSQRFVRFMAGTGLVLALAAQGLGFLGVVPLDAIASADFLWILMAVICLSGYVGAAVAGSYGRELFLSFIDLQVSAHSAPDSFAGAHVRTITGLSLHGLGTLRHALYEEPDCADVLVRWASLSIARRSVVPEIDDRRAKRNYVRARSGRPPAGEGDAYLVVELGRED